jgi:hypothetical protein
LRMTSFGVAMLTFVVIDNVFLDIVMQQPDKLTGFQHTGLTGPREYVNKGAALALLVALPVFAGIGAACGAFGGAIRARYARAGRRVYDPSYFIASALPGEPTPARRLSGFAAKRHS